MKDDLVHTVKNWYMAIGNKRQAETPDDRENSRFVPISPKTLHIVIRLRKVEEREERRSRGEKQE